MPYRILGVHDDYFQKTDPEATSRQKTIYRHLAVMLLVLALLSGVSFGVYGLAVFHSWVVAVFLGITMTAIVFNLMKTIIVLSIVPKQAHIFDPWIDQRRFFEHHYGQDMKNLTEEKALEIVYGLKQTLREKQGALLRETTGWGFFLKSLIKVTVMVVFALVVANGLELLLFRDSINQVLDSIKSSLSPTDYAYSHMLSMENDAPFVFLHSRSILLDLHIMSSGLGYWKWAMDFLAIGIFLAPLLIVQKSREVTEGMYVKELALSEITIGYYHFLTTEQYCQSLLDEMQHLDYHKILTGQTAP
jgi:hypothetical protein